jgi:hypothetical protein
MGEEVRLQNFYENTRPAFEVTTRPRRAFLQNFHPDPVPPSLERHGYWPICFGLVATCLVFRAALVGAIIALLERIDTMNTVAAYAIFYWLRGQ